MPWHRAVRRTRRRWVLTRSAIVLVAGLTACALVTTAPALAFWRVMGAGMGSVLTGTLAAPASVTVPSDAQTTVAVGWNPSGGTLSPTGYVVTRSTGTTLSGACGSSASSLIEGTSCTDSPGGDGSYTYTVTAVYRSWTAVSAPSAAVRVAAASNLGFTVQPTDTVSRAVISPAVSVTVRSADNRAVLLAGIAVTIAIATNPSGGMLSGTLTRSTDASGVASFTDLSVDAIGVGYTLGATSLGLTAGTSSQFTVVAAPLAAPNLGTAAPYSALGSAVTNGGVSSLSGDVGASPGVAVTGFPEGSVQGETHAGDAIAAQAFADLSAAYANVWSRPIDTSFAGDQSGATFYSGVHSTSSAFALAASGVLTLDAQGNPNAVFIFKVDGALNTAALSTIQLINGARASNVFWAATGAVGTGANSSFSGTILTAGAITIGAGGTLTGRALSMGAITLSTNTIRFTVALPPTISIDGGLTSSTTDRTPTITGTSTALPGRTVAITIGSQVLTATVLPDQTWATTASELVPGSYLVFVRVRDADGNAATARQTLAVL